MYIYEAGSPSGGPDFITVKDPGLLFVHKSDVFFSFINLKFECVLTLFFLVFFNPH